MNDNIATLISLVKDLKELNNSMTTKSADGFIEYDVDGTAHGIRCLNLPGEVERVFMSKGTTFIPHAHENWEYGVVYKGKLVLHGNNGEDEEINKNDWVVFRPGEKHSGTMLEDTWMFFISIPPDEGYP